MDGKELIARMVHRFSALNQVEVPVDWHRLRHRCRKASVPARCAGRLLADMTCIGLFEAAHGGTVFLDEIGEIESLNFQLKLLRFLQERGDSIRLSRRSARGCGGGGHQSRSAGRWWMKKVSPDLWFRLNVIRSPPPLRERRGDVPCRR